MDALTDRKAVQLAELLALYFNDCRAEDPNPTPASELTVLELVEDLAASVHVDDQRRIEEHLDVITGTTD